jgi:two-component system nitrate/nitrite response regulator NarL
VVRIFVVDDNPAVRRYLRGVLEQQNGWFVCGEACNGQEAVERFSEVGSDLVLLDFQLPQMNGLDVARHIIQRSPGTPILMVTLFLSSQLSEEARKIGVRGLCAKTDISSVVEAVEALLRDENYFPN